MTKEKCSPIREGLKRSNTRHLAFLKNTLNRKRKKGQRKKSSINVSQDHRSDDEVTSNHDFAEEDDEDANIFFFNDDDGFENINEETNAAGFGSSSSSSTSIETRRLPVIERRVPSFDMKQLSKNLTIISNQAKKLPRDNKTKLSLGGKVQKGSFARAILDWSEEYNVPTNGQDALLNILYNSFDGFNLPVSKSSGKNTHKQIEFLHEFKHLSIQNEETESVSEDGVSSEGENENDDDGILGDDSSSICTEDLTANVIKASLNEYSAQSTRYVAVDQCINDCFVYAGSNSKQYSCPHCAEIRFRPCKRTFCVGKGGTNCDHLSDSNGDGIALKKLFYRPLLVLISDLLRTPRFLSSLKYERVKVQSTNLGRRERSCYSDIMDGSVVQYHLSMMLLKYNNWKDKKPERVNSEEVSLLFSEFYDGGQVFKSKTSNFWALMTQILNLPPPLRGKLGIGMFLSAIYSGKHKEAEKFLFTDMYCEELRLLYDGTELVLNGKRYYVQARLVLHTLDTKAAEAVLGLQSAGSSKNGCSLCRSVTGVYDGSKCVYIGHRQLLPPTSYLRFIGQSGQCCPVGFYNDDDGEQTKTNETFEHGEDSFAMTDYKALRTIDNKVNEGINRVKLYSAKDLETLKLKAWNNLKGQAGVKGSLRFCIPCDNDSSREAAIQNFFFVQARGFYWSHKYPDFSDSVIDKNIGLRKYLIYRHFDLRQHRPYSRVTYDDHLENAIAAKALNERNRSQKKKHSKGIQDVWSFDRLPYADLSQQVTWPFLHSVTGVVKNLTNLILGVKQKENNTRKKDVIDPLQKHNKDDDFLAKHSSSSDDEKQTKPDYMDFYRFRPLLSTNNKQAFTCSQADKKRCREWLQCIILPTGLNEDSWDMRKFIINDDKLIPGFMKMNQRLKLVSCFWNLIIHAMESIEAPYKLFFLSVGVNLRRLQSLSFHSQDIEQLANDIIEMVCLWEGLLPLKWCTFLLHELIDLVPFIKKFGPPMGVSEFPGERAVGALINRKLKCNAGGVSFEDMVIKRHIKFELRELKGFYAQRSDEDINFTGLSYSSTDGKCRYNEDVFSIFKPESKSSEIKNPYTDLSEYEMDFLMDTLILEIERRYSGDIDRCCKSSALYSLEFKRRNTNNKNIGSMNWLHFISNNLDSTKFSTEEVRVAKRILSFKPTYFQKAMINSLKFSSRGSWCRETIGPTKLAYGQQSKQDLKGSKWSDLNTTFLDKSSSSSWCMLKQHKCDMLYGQLNSFFKIDIGDASLDGLLVASVTCRKHGIIPRTNLVRIGARDSFDISTLFITITDIYPSRIATVPFDSSGKAIRVRINDNRKSSYSTKNNNKLVLKELLMLSLHPERLKTNT